MKSNCKKIVSVILSTLMALMCISFPVSAEVPLIKSGSKMTWFIKTVKAVPGDDVKIDIIAESPVALRNISNIGLKCDSPIQPVGMSERCDTYNGAINTSISGNSMMFEINGSNPSSGTDGAVLFSAYFHVPENCPAGKYTVSWIAESMTATTSTGSAYFPLLRAGYINVGSGASIETTTSVKTTTTTTTSTTTTTTSSSTATTSSTTFTSSSTTTTSSTTITTTTAPPDKAFVILEQPESSQLYAGNSVNLNYSFSDSSAFSGNIWFESDNWSVAGVSDNKILNINSAGTAVITINAMRSDGSVAKSSITIIASDKPLLQEYTLGDVNGDNVIDGIDATLVLREYTLIISGETGTFSENQKPAADVNNDSVIDGIDATLILRYYTLVISSPHGTMPSISEWIQNSLN